MIRMALGTARVLAGAAVEAVRAPRCRHCFNFRTRDDARMDAHVYINHAEVLEGRYR